MKLHGYCTCCHRVRRVTAHMHTVVGGGTPQGVCDDCREKRDSRATATSPATLSVGTLLRVGRQKAVVLKVGRGVCRSVVVHQEDETNRILTEVDWWIANSETIEVLKTTASNTRWARQYVQTHPDLPIV